MHTHVVQTKFTFGDRVRFDSPTQRRSGTGAVVGVTIWTPSGGGEPIDYTLQVDGELDLWAGILEHEMVFLEDDD
jgi:hypothetical protein